MQIIKGIVFSTLCLYLTACQVGLSNPLYLSGGGTFEVTNPNPRAPEKAEMSITALGGGHAEAYGCVHKIYVRVDALSSSNFDGNLCDN